MFSVMYQKKKIGKDNQEIVHKWYRLGISGELNTYMGWYVVLSLVLERGLFRYG